MRNIIIALMAAVMLSYGCGAGSYQTRMNLANRYLNQRQYDNAKIEILKMIEEHPQNPDPYYLLGILHYRQGKFGECLFNLDEADRRGFEPSQEYYLIKGISQYHLTDISKAATTLERMPNVTSSGIAQKYLGIIYTKLKKYPEAVQAFDRTSDMSRDVEALSAQGKALFNSGETSRALEVYQKALILAPDDDELLFQAASLSMLTGNDREAYDLYGRIDKNSRYAVQMLYNRAEAAIKIGEFAAAVGLLQTYLEYRPDDSAARINLASALIKTGEYVRAADLLAPLAAREYSARAAYNLALANYKLGKYEESAYYLAGVVKEYPDNVSYRYAYGLALSSSGDMAAAAEQMSTVLVLEPSHTDAQSWLKQHIISEK